MYVHLLEVLKTFHFFGLKIQCGLGRSINYFSSHSMNYKLAFFASSTAAAIIFSNCSSPPPLSLSSIIFMSFCCCNHTLYLSRGGLQSSWLLQLRMEVYPHMHINSTADALHQPTIPIPYTIKHLGDSVPILENFIPKSL